MEGFNVQSINTNEDVVVTYTPSEFVFRYIYILFQKTIV